MVHNQDQAAKNMDAMMNEMRKQAQGEKSPQPMAMPDVAAVNRETGRVCHNPVHGNRPSEY